MQMMDSLPVFYLLSFRTGGCPYKEIPWCNYIVRNKFIKKGTTLDGQEKGSRSGKSMGVVIMT